MAPDPPRQPQYAQDGLHEDGDPAAHAPEDDSSGTLRGQWYGLLAVI